MLTVIARAALANDVHVNVATEPGSACRSATVVATADGGERHEWQASVPGGVSIDIPLNTTWTLTTAADGCWSKPAVLAVGIPVQDVALRLWPARPFRARVRFQGTRVPPSVAVRLSAGADSEYLPAACRTTDDVSVCEIPATVVDVRVTANGYGAKYVWNVDASHDVKLDDIVLRPGSAISGRVTTRRRDSSGSEIAVALRAVDVDPPRTLKTAKASASGWFQFDGLPAGSYTLVATKTGYAKAQATVVTSDPKNIELSPLMLERLVPFSVTISPPADPSGAPWHVVLDRRTSESRFLTRVTASAADAAGRWDTDNIEPGKYIVSVLDAAGNTFAAEETDISDSQTSAFVSIASVNVSGRLSKGGHGIAASLAFNGRDHRDVAVQADDDGAFRGTLPREGRWWVDIRPAGSHAVLRRGPIDVHPDDSGAARIDLTIAEGSLSGTVVDEHGEPVDATVFLYRRGQRVLEAEAPRGDGGKFTFDDLQPGAIIVEAQSSKGESGLVELDLKEQPTEDVRLVIQKRATVTGSITTPSGYPVTGAYVRASGRAFRERRETITGPGGEFTLKVPHGVSSITVAVLPAEGPILLRRLMVTNTPQRITAAPAGGRIVVRGGRGWPFIVGVGDDAVSVVDLIYPRGAGTPREVTRDGIAIEIEPGSYAVCTPPLDERRCEPAAVAAGQTKTVDFGGER